MPETDEKHEKARDLAEAALGEYAKGDEKKGDKLAQEAVKIDKHAVEELVEDMDEDAETTGAAGADGKK